MEFGTQGTSSKYKGSYHLVVFNVISGVIAALASKWPLTPTRLVGKKTGVRFVLRNTANTIHVYGVHVPLTFQCPWSLLGAIWYICLKITYSSKMAGR